MYPDDRGLDPQVDVLRHQGDACLRKFALQGESVREDVIVRPVARQIVWQPGIQLAGLEEKMAGARLLAVIARLGGWQFQPVVNLLLGRVVHQLIEEPAHLAHVARGLGQTLLPGVELLENDHRNVDVVFLEAKDRRGIVHQHVGVEDENAALWARGRCSSQ